jgi:hypothetical protein
MAQHSDGDKWLERAIGDAFRQLDSEDKAWLLEEAARIRMLEVELDGVTAGWGLPDPSPAPEVE